MAKKTSGKSARRKPVRTRTRKPSGKLAKRAASGERSDPEDAAVGPADLGALESGKLYYRIGEVSQITGVKPYVLRYWESEFRLMAPQKSRSKQRLYRRKDIDTILHIKRLLYEERYTIAGARRRLRELGAAGVRAEAEAESPYRKIRDELLSIRGLLAADL